MKSIGYIDINDGNKTLNVFTKQDVKRIDRIMTAIHELKPVGNIAVYLINGRKIRRLFIKKN